MGGGKRGEGEGWCKKGASISHWHIFNSLCRKPLSIHAMPVPQGADPVQISTSLQATSWERRQEYGVIQDIATNYAMLCYAMLCYAMLCYAMLCYAVVLWDARLCYAMVLCATSCHALLPKSTNPE